MPPTWRTVRVWDLTSARLVHEFYGHEHFISGVVYL